jgi:hypothetical protein
MRKGATISSQTTIFAVSALLAVGILGGAVNILENSAVEQRLNYYRAEELATSIGVVGQYGEGRLVKFEKTLGNSYKVKFEQSSGTHNLTISESQGDPNTAEVRIPTNLDIQSPNDFITDGKACIEKTRSNPSSPEKVEISAGSC